MVATAKQAPQGEITTLLGRGAAFEGKLTFDGTVRIDGRFKGEVFSDDVLVIGEGAHVEAEIDIGEVIIQGTVVGNVKAKRSIEIHAPGPGEGRSAHAEPADRQGRDLRGPIVHGERRAGSAAGGRGSTGAATQDWPDLGQALTDAALDSRLAR